MLHLLISGRSLDGRTDSGIPGTNRHLAWRRYSGSSSEPRQEHASHAKAVSIMGGYRREQA